jgi:methyl-accepting chemotaxis protein
MLFARRRDPVIEELKQRLTSLDQNCLAGLERGVAAIAAGDLTVSVTPATTPITTHSKNAQVAELVAIFNSMLGRAQSALGGYEQVRADLAVALGDQSCLVELQARLTSLDGNCLAALSEGLEAVATQGDLTLAATPVTKPLEARGGHELGTLADIFNSMLGRAKGSLDAYNAMRADLEGFATTASQIADGDLTVEVTPKSAHDRLGQSFETMADKLRALVGEVREQATSLSGSSREMVQSSEEAGRAVEEIARAVAEVASGAERQVRSLESAQALTMQVAAATEASARVVLEANHSARQASESAEQGAQIVSEVTDAMHGVSEASGLVTEAMRELAEKSERIGGIVTKVTGIAEQTNLLALNAAIEAARAGEQGRGFAVVAEEVRKLAEESQGAAGSIAQLIGEIQRETARAQEVVAAGAERTEHGAQTVADARESFLHIATSVQGMTAQIDEVSAEITRISEGSADVSRGMSEVAAVAEQSSASAEQVSASTQETTASAQQIAATAMTLADRAGHLEHVLEQFTLR